MIFYVDMFYFEPDRSITVRIHELISSSWWCDHPELLLQAPQLGFDCRESGAVPAKMNMEVCCIRIVFSPQTSFPSTPIWRIPEKQWLESLSMIRSLANETGSSVLLACHVLFVKVAFVSSLIWCCDCTSLNTIVVSFSWELSSDCTYGEYYVVGYSTVQREVCQNTKLWHHHKLYVFTYIHPIIERIILVYMEWTDMITKTKRGSTE